MEPVSIPAQRGTLADPEVLQNVPGHVIPILQREYDDFKTEATKFLAGELEEDEFIKFRLKQGVYGQRQPDVQMIRTKLPFGGITPEQMDKFADVVEKYAPLKKGHITTRQNIQIHHVPLLDAEKAIRELGEAGLSSREGCGNTMRNVTADPWAGVAQDELFDLTPYAGAYVRYFVRHPTTQAMPRKVKTSFDASPADRAISEIHDVAFRARVREIDGGQVRGVQMLVGGGTSIMPRKALELYDFVTLDDGEYLKRTEAVMRIFDRQEWLRANRARARIKVFVDKYGIDELRRQAEEELQGEWVAERDFSIEQRVYAHDEREEAPAPPDSFGSPNGDVSEFERFRAANVQPQRQDGFVAVEVKITRGDLTPEDFRGLAQVMRDYSGGYARTTVQQNLVLRWVREECVYDVWRALSELGFGEAGSREITDVVSCPGTDSCKLGITSSMGVNQAVQERLAGDGHQRPARAPDPHQDQRLPQRLRPAPRRQHRLHGRLDQSRRAHDPRLHPPRRRRVRRRRGVRHTPEAAPAFQARARGGRALGAPLRISARGRRDLDQLRAARRHRAAGGAGQGPLDARRLLASDDERVHRLEPRCALRSHPRRGRVRGLGRCHVTTGRHSRRTLAA